MYLDSGNERYFYQMAPACYPLTSSTECGMCGEPFGDKVAKCDLVVMRIGVRT